MQKGIGNHYDPKRSEHSTLKVLTGETDSWNASVAMEADISRADEGRPDEVKGGFCKRGCFITLKRIVVQATSKTFSLRARSA